MAFDLTDYPVPQESNCYMQLGWQCDFYFGYGFDVIEEDATNEKYCIQVLRILITKADTEIEELEKDLVFLQNELAGVEYEEWFEIYCNALRKQIDCLYIVNEQPLDLMVLDTSDSTAHTAEHLAENTKFIYSDLSAVVKEESQASSITYMGNGSFLNASLMHQEKKKNNSEAVKVCCEQLRQIDVKDSSPNSLKSEAGDLDEKEVLSCVNTGTSMKAEAREHCFTSMCNNVIQTSSSNSTDERKYNLEVVMDQFADITLKNSNGGGLKHIVNCSNKKKKLCTSDLKIVSDESEENSSASIEDVIGVDLALKSMGKNANLCKRVKLVSVVTEDLDSNACTPEEGHPDVKRIMCMPDLEVNGNEEVSTFLTTTASKDKILDSSSNPKGKVNPPKAEKVLPANAVMQDANADALRHATGVSRGRNNSDLRYAIPRQAKVGNSDSSSECTYTISHTSISRQEKGGNFDTGVDALRPATELSRRRNDSDSALTASRQLQVQNSDISTAALCHATGLDQRRNNSDSKVPAFRQAIVGNCNFDKKLCDFAQKSMRKRGMKESSLILSDVLKSSNLSSEAKGKRKPSLQNVKAKKSCLTDTQQSASSSLLHLQDDKGKMTANAQTVERKTQEDVQTAETVANNVKFNSDFSVKPQKNYVKRKFKLNPLSAKESGFQSVERIPQSSFIAKAKRHWKSEPVSDSSSSDHSLNTKILKKAAQHGQCGGKEPGIGFDDSQNSISLPQKKRKKNTSIPEVVEIKGSILQIDLLKSPNYATVNDDNWITESCYNSIDCCTEVVTSLPFSTSKLMELKIGELRAIAKEQKLTKYYKLRKTDLVERIAKKLGSC